MLAFFRSRTKDITWFIVWFIVITFSLSLLGSGLALFMGGPPPKSARRNPASPDAPDPADDPEAAKRKALLDSPKPFARVRAAGVERVVTEGELERRLQQTELRQGRPLPEEARKFYRPLILNRLVDEALMEMEADRLDIDVSAKVDEQLQEIYARTGGKEKYLEVTGQTEADVRALLVKQFKVSEVTARARKGPPVSEAEMKAYYEAHIKDFTAEGAAAAKPFDEVKDQVEAAIRSDVTSADVAEYYAAHRARWQEAPKVELLHLAVNPVSADRKAATTATEEEVAAYYEAHKGEYLEREKVEIAHIFIDPAHPDIAAASKPTADEVAAYYADNKEEFEEEPEALLSQILVGGSDGAERARKILDRLRGGESFAEVASVSSEEEGAAASGGDLGWMARSAVPAALARVVFEAPLYKITDPIRTPQGYHIVWVRDRREGKVRPLDEVRGEITRVLEKEKAFDVARAKADEVHALAAAEGADFAALATAHSHAASKAAGGEVGVVTLGENEPRPVLEEVGSHGFLDFAIQKALEGLEVGKITPPTRSFKGYHILKLDGRPARGSRPLEAVRKVIENAVQKEKAAASVAAVLKGAKDAVAGKSPADGKAAFLAYAKEHSDSADVAINGGDWGLVTLDSTSKPTLPKEVRGEVVSWDGLSRRIVEAVKARQAGELTDPIKLSAMQHMFYVARRAETSYKPLEAVAEEIRGVLNPQFEESELKEYFEQNKAEYQKPKESGQEVAHILLADESRAAEVLEQIKNGQLTFEEAVERFSMDGATKKTSGKVSGGIRIPAIQAAVAATKPGALHEKPVESPVGWHILKVGSKGEPEKEVGFEDVRDKIRERLLETRQRATENSWIQELKNGAEIEILMESDGGNPMSQLLGGLGGQS